jgi:hypothetical protein
MPDDAARVSELPLAPSTQMATRKKEKAGEDAAPAFIFWNPESPAASVNPSR